MCYMGPTLKFLCVCCLGMKFGMVRLDACIDGVGGFLDSIIIIVVVNIIIIIIIIIIFIVKHS